MSKTNWILILTLALVLFALNSCASGPVPRLLGWQPGSIDQAPLTAPIELRFDQLMDADSIRSGFQITPSVPLSLAIVFSRSTATPFISPFASPLPVEMEPAMI